MNVRRASVTTLSIIVLSAGLCILIPVILNTVPYEVQRTLEIYFNPNRINTKHIGGYHIFVIYAAVWLVAVAGMIDSIINSRIAFALFRFFKILIILAVFLVTFALLPTLISQGRLFCEKLFWGLFYVIMILSVYRAFQNLIKNYRPASQKLIPFLKTGRDADDPISDYYAVVGMSLVLVGAGVLLVISFVVFMISGWRTILTEVVYLFGGNPFSIPWL